MDGFQKRSYTPCTLVRDLREIMAHMPEFKETARSERVSRAFAEKIMMINFGNLAGNTWDAILWRFGTRGARS